LSADLLDPQYHGKNGFALYHADYATYMTAILQGSDLEHDLKNLPLENKDLEGSYYRFAGSAWFACRGRRLFSTDRGYLGLGPKLLEPGDVIYILHGGRVPYAFRPAGNGYRLVGECHVEGFMEGQLVDQWHKDRKKLEKARWKLSDVLLR
jgi:hypothetical protein